MTNDVRRDSASSLSLAIDAIVVERIRGLSAMPDREYSTAPRYTELERSKASHKARSRRR
jgi:hypothetical protein